MAPPKFGAGRVIRIEDDGTRVTNVDIGTPVMSGGMAKKLREARARARALATAGFASDGFVRNMNLALQVPDLERRTEIVDERKVSDDAYNYTIRVRPGPVLE